MERILLERANLGDSSFYFYSESLIQKNINQFKSVPYPHLGIHFASMANDNPTLLKMLESNGFGIFVNSRKHMQLALDCGFSPNRIIFPAFAFRHDIKRVLCFGGANGGVLNRLRLIPSVEEVVQVDIDPQLYALSKHYLPFLHWSGPLPFQHTLHFHSNPYDWLHELSDEAIGTYDLVIADLPDSTGDSYVPQLFTHAFYQKVKSLLTTNGAVVTQAGQMNPLDLGFHLRVRDTIRRCFDFVCSYSSFVPSYGTPWGFLYASMNINPDRISSHTLGNNLGQIKLDALTYYDHMSHEHCFNLPKPIRKAISSSEKKVIDDNNLATVDIATHEEVFE
ncbi:hypothetical protein HC752_18770 [Vibrio sp. S9_S30]|uniref:spermine/spermidine synthase domain-containing protein n=1 Tax=Vibrio sp. S9_S30 TaxID=2720226 RepID=UPI0016801533|nr:hypothetical protein [Vibrio sp. S9_S30]MBD1558983.1 hypothetical protein [Vibrio sp. S9_S30]